MRTDAERNRALLVEAAREVFAEDGLDAPLTDVAHRAGVGIATLYRRFPTREELVTAAFAARMAEYVAAAEGALEAPDPWDGFAGFVWATCAMQAPDRGFADLLGLVAGGAFAAERSRAYWAFVRVVQRAKRAGVLREDFSLEDLVLVQMANAGLLDRTADTAPDAWRRLVAYLLESFRAPGTGQLPPAPTPRQVYRAIQGSGAP